VQVVTDTPNHVVNVADELTLLEQRRVALERLIRIGQSLEALQQGLQAVTDLKTSSALPDAAVRTFEALGRKIRNLSDAQVKVRLDTLDAKVATKLKLVLGLADELQPDQAQTADGARLAVINDLVDEFKKHAQTAVALRVLLTRRGVDVEPLALSVPEQTLRERLTFIASREHQCRGAVVQQVKQLRSDVQRLLANPSCKPTLKAVMTAVLDALQANLVHLNEGKPVSSLPTPIADIAFDTTPFSGVSYVESAPEARPGPDESEPDVPMPVNSSAATATPASSPAKNKERVPTAASPAAKPGFWRRFKNWIDTPWHVGWKDIERTPDKSRKK